MDTDLRCLLVLLVESCFCWAMLLSLQAVEGVQHVAVL